MNAHAIANRFTATIRTLRSGGKSDESIARTLGLTPTQAKGYGLQLDAAPAAGQGSPARRPLIATIVRGGDAGARVKRIAETLKKRHDGDQGAAADDMARHFDEMLPIEQAEVIRRGCIAILGDTVVRLAVRSTPRPVEPARAPEQGGERMAARLRNMGVVYDWTLPNGTTLGDATLADLDAAIAHHASKTLKHGRLGQFYRTVRDRLAASGKPVVAEAIDATTLESLQKDATP